MLNEFIQQFSLVEAVLLCLAAVPFTLWLGWAADDHEQKVKDEKDSKHHKA